MRILMIKLREDRKAESQSKQRPNTQESLRTSRPESVYQRSNSVTFILR